MFSVLMKITKIHYHKAMYAYNFILYKDCLDVQMKETFYKKLQEHKKN